MLLLRCTPQVYRVNTVGPTLVVQALLKHGLLGGFGGKGLVANMSSKVGESEMRISGCGQERRPVAAARACLQRAAQGRQSGGTRAWPPSLTVLESSPCATLLHTNRWAPLLTTPVAAATCIVQAKQLSILSANRWHLICQRRASAACCCTLVRRINGWPPLVAAVTACAVWSGPH